MAWLAESHSDASLRSTTRKAQSKQYRSAMIGGNPQKGLVTSIDNMIGRLIGLEAAVGRVMELFSSVV